MTSNQPNLSLLLNMNVGFLGMQIGNGLQTANASAIFEGLGAEVSQLPFFWLGAPLLGLVAQPIVGELSDRTWNRLGRRQPYFITGAALGTVALVAMPLSSQLWQAVTLFWILQLALNVAIAPARPFVGDLLSPQQRTLGYSVQGICIGLGTLVASALPWALEHVFALETTIDAGIPPAIIGAYGIGAVILLGGTAWTLFAIDEPLPQGIKDKATDDTEGVISVVQAIAHAIPQMPSVMRQLIGVQALTWAGVYCTFLYLPTAIALNVMGAPNRQSPSYAHGVEWAGVCIAAYNLVCLVVSFFIPVLSRLWGRVTLHGACLMCGSVGLISLLWVHNQYLVLPAMVGVGIAWSSILAIPYSLLMDELSEEQSGVYMGLFNVFITLPQIAMSLGFGWVMKHVLQGDRLSALILGGISMGVAAVLTLNVSEPETTTEQEWASAGD